MSDVEEQKTETWHMEPYFRGTSHASGALFIVIDEMEAGLPVLEEGFLCLELVEGTTGERAREIVNLLNENVRFISYTGPDRPEWKDRPGRLAMAQQNRKPRLDRPILDKLVAEVRHFGDRDFLKAAMAVCALVAVADGNVLRSEHDQIEKVLETEPALKELDTEKALDTLFEYIYALRTYGQEAEDILRNKIGRMAGLHKRARTLMRVAYMVIVADGEIQDGERVEFQRLCQLLDLNPEKVWGDLEA